MSRLMIYPKKGDPYAIKIPDSELYIGRSSTNDLTLADKGCSSRHAIIYPTPKGFAIRDMNSRNGTRVNQQRITRETELNKDDKIEIGSTIIYFDKEDLTHSSQTVLPVKTILKKPPTAADIVDHFNRDLFYYQDLDRFLDQVMNAIISYIPMDRGVLILKEGRPEKLEQKVLKTPSRKKEMKEKAISQSIVRMAIRENKAILKSDVWADPDLKDQPSIVISQIHSALCVPLWDGTVVMGVIYADRISVTEPFNDADLRHLTLLANLSAHKIRDLKFQMERRREQESAIQRRMAVDFLLNLLPKTDPGFESFDISGSAQFCEYVGGDYFNYIPLDASRLAVVIADVSGSGVPAALHMSNLNGSLLAEIRRTNELSILAADLNDIVYNKSELTCFISFFMGIIDRDRGQMMYVNAGHNPPFLIVPKGQVRSLDSTGLCLGMFPDIKFETDMIPINPGDLLCLYTDGITESKNDGKEEYGEERLIDILKETSRLPARNILNEVYASVFNFSQTSEPEDDMTLVVVKRIE